MNPVAIVTFLGSSLILYLLISGKWDSVIDEITGHGHSHGDRKKSAITHSGPIPN